jgi:glutaredoxin
MFFSQKKNLYVFSFICITTFISCSNSYKKESQTAEKKIVTGKIMKNESNSLESESNTEKNQINLYVYPNCPYCKKVINFLRSKNHLDKITIIDVTKKTNMQELHRLNKNNSQCPFLYDVEKNIKMLESDDIIKYLSKRF